MRGLRDGKTVFSKVPSVPAPPPNLIIPPPVIPASAEMLDFSKPPPGFGPLPPQNLPPPPLVAPKDPSKPFAEIEMPYYNLPAGLMVPHVKVH